MRLLIITSCTGEKKVSPDHQLTLEDFQKGSAHVRVREKELKEFLTPAGEIYTGEQHVRLMRGLSAVRAPGSDLRPLSSDLWILSAGYGLIPEDRKIAPYECTFATMKTKEIRAWADQLNVPADFRRIVSGSDTLAASAGERAGVRCRTSDSDLRPPNSAPISHLPSPISQYDLGLILLGDNYLQACQLDDTVKFGGFTLLFCGEGPAKKIPRLPNLRVVTLSNPEAKRFSCGLVGLKGEIAARLLKLLSADPHLLQKLRDHATDVLALLDEGVPTKPEKGKRTSRANPNVDYVIQIPQTWWDKPHRQKFRYFIPEWDDYVDPDYDFIKDEHSGGMGDWNNEVYAHQMYPEPNYDGILMSRAVAEKSKKKDARVNAMGVHRFLRVPREFPIMGDCGAFDYIEQKTPPYTTDDVLDYYTRLDFDYGASVDHLVVPAFEADRDFRYELTIHNAEDFIRKHRKAGLKWEPIGSVQGWDAKCYADAARKYVKMGYRSIALGGLVRCTSLEIAEILKQVHAVVSPSTNIHLFGIARPEALKLFTSLGVTSVDSASHLRRAWLVARDNYFALDGESYSSLRIPAVGKSYRAKRVIAQAKLSTEALSRLEQKCLTAVRAFDAGKGHVKSTIDLLLEYHNLISEGGPDMREEYRRTLETMPWKKCPCDICRTWGVEVMIFRGNNRNRRRGFHNTYVFYRLMQMALEGKGPLQKKTAQMQLFEEPVGA